MGKCDNYKFEGILSDIDIDKIHKNKLFNLLIERNIYHLMKDCIPPDKKHIKTFGEYFFYKNNYYVIKKEVLNDVYYYIESVLLSKAENPKLKNKLIEYEIEGIESISKKIDVLSYHFTNSMNEINTKELLIYRGIEVGLHSKWKDYIISEFILMSDFAIYEHLSGYSTNLILSADINNILENWKKIYYHDAVCEFCTNRIKQLKASQSKEKIELNLLTGNETENVVIENYKKKHPIFKGDSEQHFHYIIENYKGVLNKAFFSHLYAYFNDELKCLLTAGKDSKEYRDYILSFSNFNLSGFSKVITYEDYSPTKVKMFDTFRKLTQEFIQNKI